MLDNAIKWHQPQNLPKRSRSGKKGSLEINTLVIWVILLVFLALVLIIILAIKTKGDGIIAGTCGLLGC